MWKRDVGQGNTRIGNLLFSLTVAGVALQLTWGLELLWVADIARAPTCAVRFATRDVLKLRRWNESEVLARSKSSSGRELDLMRTARATSTDGSDHVQQSSQRGIDHMWPRQAAFVTKLQSGVVAYGRTGEYRIANSTHQVWTTNLQNTRCAVACPERDAPPRPQSVPRGGWWSAASPEQRLDPGRPSPFESDGHQPMATPFEDLLVLPSPHSYWAARRYQHALLDLLPHVVAFLPYLLMYPHVKVVVPVTFHDFFQKLGVSSTQLVDTKSSFFVAKTLHIGLFLDPDGRADSIHCASCCATCWRNAGLIAHFHTTALTPYLESLKRQCLNSTRWTFVRCLRTDVGQPGNHRRGPPQLVLEGVMTIQECMATATRAGALQFGLEHPDGTDVAGTAQCFISRPGNTMFPWHRHSKASECQKRVDAGDDAKQFIGGAFRLALYERVCANTDPQPAAHSLRRAVVYAARPVCFLPRCRMVANQDEVMHQIINTVHRLRPDLDVVPFQADHATWQQTFEYQAQLFNRAEVVIGAHGGAITNLIFMQPGMHARVRLCLNPD